jgi:hypothetical protein
MYESTEIESKKISNQTKPIHYLITSIFKHYFDVN